MLQQRSLTILELFLSEKVVSTNKIQNDYSLTASQVNYEILRIIDWLEVNGFKKMEKNSNDEYILSDSPRDIIRVLKDETHYVLNSDERKDLIFLFLFINKGNVSIFHLTDLLAVSRGTVNTDLKSMEKSLEQENISLLYSRKIGYYLQSEEHKIRKYSMQIIIKCLSNNHSLLIINRILDNKDFKKIKLLQNKLSKICYDNNLYISEINKNNLIYLIYFVFLRNRIVQDYSYYEKVINYKKFREYYMAKDIEYTLCGYSSEMSYFITSLLLSNITPNENVNDFTQINSYVVGILSTLENSYGLKIEKSIDGHKKLFSHFRMAYYRVIFEYPILNPLKERIKNEYGVIFKLVKEVIYQYDELNKINEDELAFLTTHFVNLVDIEKSEDKENRIIAGVICPNGLGVSSILNKTLKDIFPDITFLKPIPIDQIVYYESKVDLFFSTKLVDTTKSVFVVNPIMSNAEVAHIYKRFQKEFRKSKVVESNYIQDLMKIIKTHASIKNFNELETQLTGFINDYVVIESEDRQPMLSEIISEELITLNIEALDWRDAIRKSAQSLVDTGKVTTKYVDEMIEISEESGPYIVITENVALPHARPESGVNALAISISTLKTSINFGNNDNDPVKYIFCLGSLDHKSHLRALSELVELLGDQRFIELLNRSNEPKEIINYINLFEESSDFK